MVAKNTVDEGMEFRRNFIAGTNSNIKKVELVNTHTHTQSQGYKHNFYRSEKFTENALANYQNMTFTSEQNNLKYYGFYQRPIGKT